MKVLVVDDSAVMRKVLMKELTEIGVPTDSIAQASDGSEAVQAVGTETFDLILMDWNMPNMLGIDAVKEIRAKGVKSAILMVTTEAEKTNVVRAIQAGASNYLVKPFTKDDFSAKVNSLVGELILEAQKANQIVDLNTGRITAE